MGAFILFVALRLQTLGFHYPVLWHPTLPFVVLARWASKFVDPLSSTLGLWHSTLFILEVNIFSRIYLIWGCSGSWNSSRGCATIIDLWIGRLSPHLGSEFSPLVVAAHYLDPMVLLWWFAFWNMAYGRLTGVEIVLRWRQLIDFGSGDIVLCIGSGDIVLCIRSGGGCSNGLGFLILLRVMSWLLELRFQVGFWFCFWYHISKINFGFGSGIQVACEFGIWVSHIIFGFGILVFVSCSWAIVCHPPSFLNPW